MSDSRLPGVSGSARRHLAEARSAIEARLASQRKSALASIGDGDAAVVVRLVPGAAPVAAELKSEFGDMVSITVGFKPFPPGETLSAPLPLELSETGGGGIGLRVTCAIGSTRIPQGDSATGQLVIFNRQDARTEFLAAASTGWLCAPGTLNVVGGYSGAIAAASRMVKLDAGGSIALNYIVGTASWEANDQYVVGPGTYEVVVPLSIWSPDGTGHRVLLARDCFVIVTEPLSATAVTSPAAHFFLATPPKKL